ncbi:MAG: hypothetical protein ACRDIB_12235 [Ardenticatenaceae bacterium]
MITILFDGEEPEALRGRVLHVHGDQQATFTNLQELIQFMHLIAQIRLGSATVQPLPPLDPKEVP